MENKARAQEAQMLLQNRTMQDAFDTLKAFYTDQMIQTEPEDREGRDQWHMRLLALKDVKTALTSLVEDGKIEASNEAKRERAENDRGSSNSRDKR